MVIISKKKAEQDIQQIPNPGSEKALKQGCTCPVLDNNHGAGWKVRGIQQFWISEDCPLHARKKKNH